MIQRHFHNKVQATGDAMVDRFTNNEERVAADHKRGNSFHWQLLGIIYNLAFIVLLVGHYGIDVLLQKPCSSLTTLVNLFRDTFRYLFRTENHSYQRKGFAINGLIEGYLV